MLHYSLYSLCMCSINVLTVVQIILVIIVNRSVTSRPDGAQRACEAPPCPADISRSSASLLQEEPLDPLTLCRAARREVRHRGSALTAPFMGLTEVRAPPGTVLCLSVLLSVLLSVCVTC
ncbi:hypothetical protein JOB18_009238 [Solea senegalensis]|uniref:Uncharacterized protein n=1 Tax=Solea senegalensis TaxID=28829 RepID=A0AAV6PFN5_SOLSE|nr:hypothetical protein JOB18_009238 [Solea senegalensis]